MKNKITYLYLTTISIFLLSGIFIFDSNKKNIQYLDFSDQPIEINLGENKN